MSFQDQYPEIAQNPLPATLEGETPIPTNLHTLRLSQLVNLAKAFGIQVRDGITKTDLIPIMAQAERTGVFRGEVKDRYHLLLANQNPDMPLEGIDAEIAAKDLAKEHEKYKARNKKVDWTARSQAAQDESHRLRTRMKELGMSPQRMSQAAMRAAIAEKERELDEDETPDDSGADDESNRGDEAISGQ